MSVPQGKHGCNRVLPLGALLYMPAQQAQIPSQPCGFTGSAVLGCGEQGWVVTQGTPVPSSSAGCTHNPGSPHPQAPQSHCHCQGLSTGAAGVSHCDCPQTQGCHWCVGAAVPCQYPHGHTTPSQSPDKPPSPSPASSSHGDAPVQRLRSQSRPMRRPLSLQQDT